MKSKRPATKRKRPVSKAHSRKSLTAEQVREIVREEVRAGCAAILDVLALDHNSAINLVNWRYDSKFARFGTEWDNLRALARAAVNGRESDA